MEEDFKSEFVSSYKNKTSGLGDPGALFFLALPFESSNSTCDVADASLLQAWDTLARPGSLEASPHGSAPRSLEEPRGGGLANAEVGARAERGSPQPSFAFASGDSAVLPAPRPLSLWPDAWRPSASLPRRATSSCSAFSSSPSPASSVSEGKGSSLL